PDGCGGAASPGRRWLWGVVAVGGRPGARGERRGFLVQRGRRVELAALERELDEVLVVLQDVELEVVVAQDADAVDVALGEVLELRRFLAELEQDLEAVERALELADLLEVVGDLLELALALDECAPGLGARRVEADRGEAVVEVDERGLVGAAAGAGVTAGAAQPGEAGVVDQRLPRDGGLGVLLGALER